MTNPDTFDIDIAVQAAADRDLAVHLLTETSHAVAAAPIGATS